MKLLGLIEPPGPQDMELQYVSGSSGAKSNTKPCTISVQRGAAEQAWMTILQAEVSETMRKRLLGLMTRSIAPWFDRLEMLTDFLIDSFDSGGILSLMALSGLFYLMKERNLDYPQFYPTLYSMIDSYTLHSKQRMQFLRLLNTFLASTHLPASLVASFIKRLSRLCLHGPPSAITAIVPLVYNLLKSHPACTFMIHKDSGQQSRLGGQQQIVNPDPFLSDETDPMKTNAIQSSLWELETLRDHFHPNVATVARIISEQFTRPAYKVEDFLDHSYGLVRLTWTSKDEG